MLYMYSLEVRKSRKKIHIILSVSLRFRILPDLLPPNIELILETNAIHLKKR